MRVREKTLVSPSTPCAIDTAKAKADIEPDKHRGVVALRCSPLNYPTNSDGRNAFVVAASFTDPAAGENAVVSN